MGYFDNCRPEDRFTVLPRRGAYRDHGSSRDVYDWDQRRAIRVATGWKEEDEDFLMEALAEHIDDLPADTVLVELGQDGTPVFHTSNVENDTAMVPFYPSIAHFPEEIPRICRSELVEIERMGVQVDHVGYRTHSGELQHAAFKYYINDGNIAAIWHEINCVMRIPKHRHIVSFDRLVVDGVDNKDKVVGFTTPFIPGGTVQDNTSRVFKLKYLKQLFEAIDYLNLNLGIVHGDISPRNLLIDEETDDLRIFDFNWAAKLGWEGDTENNDIFGYEEERNDVKYAIFTLYEIITRDTQIRDENDANDQDVSIIRDIKIWEQHADVHLDADPSEYRRVLDVWVTARAEVDKKITHYSEAPEAINWPSLPEYSEVYYGGAMMKRKSQMRQEMVMRGEKFLKWQRPPSCNFPLPEGQELLATGQVVNSVTGDLIDPPA
ncbi:hypothetical protein B7494_g6710 [Chlorociboria aeruginascens]|nr:hypothetical protein B7494_g6710 [Chlorociboria aeruginascens]